MCRPGHYGRALEDAIASHKNQWPKEWEDKSPLSGGASFNSMNPTQRVSHANWMGRHNIDPLTALAPSNAYSLVYGCI